MLNYQLQTVSYGPNIKTSVIADGNGVGLFYNLSWDIIYSQTPHPIKLRLTSYGRSPETVEILNTNGFWHSPQDVRYSKIEIINMAPETAAADEILGIINYCSEIIALEETNKKLSNATKTSRLEYIVKNTKTILLSVPAGKQLDEILQSIGSKGIYEYYGAQYCRQDKTIEDDPENDSYPNSIQIWGNNTTAAQEWNMVLPSTSTSQTIVKGDNVRLDVYLRYWTAEPGEMV